MTDSKFKPTTEDTFRGQIGTDEWVALVDERIDRPAGLVGRLQGYAQRVPLWGWLVALLVFGSLVPLFATNNAVMLTAATVVLFGMLALGLNIVAGYAGLLDLGFVAFFGIGAYAYAYLSSDFTGVHLPTIISLPVIVAITTLFGLLLGATSLRLVGDYLAIVTLGFGLIFVQLATSLTRVDVPWSEEPLNITNGPNGIVNVDNLSLFGLEAQTRTHDYLIFLVALILVIVLVYNLNNSRIGRAWRAMREDELATEAMGMPTRRLKLLAFASGAGIAGLGGALFAALQGSVFPSNFETTILIELYAMVVLGGLGSMTGVLLGAVIMVTIPEVLRDAAIATPIFYFGLLIVLLSNLKPRWLTPVLIAAIVVFGLIVKLLVSGSFPDAVVLAEPTGAFINDTVRSWLFIPDNQVHIGNLAFVAVIGFVLAVSRVSQRWWRFGLLIPTVYLLIFAWEMRLSQEPSITRLLIIGVMLIVLMIYRPEGLFGKRRVEVM